MIRYVNIITRLTVLAALMLAAAGCHKDNYREVCDYKVQLRYDYNEENAPHGRNMIEYYVYTIDEYIFDEDGRLYDHRQITPDRCREMMNSEWDLEPGRYSVIAIGNMDDRSRPYDTANPALTKGVTLRENFRLTLDNAAAMPGGTRGPAERLYHGYRTFTVKQRGISRVRVDMINAHLGIKFRVTWKNNSTPSKAAKYYATLESVPSDYKLMPEFIYPAGVPSCQTHNPAAHDTYPSKSNDIIHHIPHTCWQNGNVLRYRIDTYVNADGEMWGDFTAYRLKKGTRPMIRIRRVSDNVQVVKDIDVQLFIDHWYGHDVDEVLKQYYEIGVQVDGNQLILDPIDIADWDEGGIL